MIIEGGLVLIRNESDRKIRLCSQKVLTNSSSMMNGAGKLMNGNLEDVNLDNNHTMEETEDDDDQRLQLMNNISLISKKAATMLANIAGNTLEAKLANILKENISLQTTVKQISTELEEERVRFIELNDSFHNNSLHLTSEMEAEIHSK